MINSKIKKVPKLRFPGFGDEWEEKKLGDIATIKTGNLNAEDALDDGKYTFFDRSVDIKKYDEYSFDNEAIIYGGEGSEFLPRYFNGRYGLHQRAYTIFGIDTIDIKFLYYYMLTQNNHFLRYAVGSTVKSLRMDCFTRCVIPFPNYEEQEKIADFLSAVDEKIDLLDKRKMLLEKYKKGVMQQIFSQKLRFKDESGNGYPDWQTKKLSEIGKTYNGLAGKSADDFGDGEPFITYKQIFDKAVIDFNKSGEVKIKPGEKQNTSQFGDIFFTTSSETPEEVGFASVQLTSNKAYLNSFSFGYRPVDLNKLAPEFARYLFRSDIFRSSMYKLAQGSTRYNISKIGFMKTVIYLPTTEEQKKIADFLSGIDEKIEAEERKLTGAKKFKKALLQQMFV